jgi:hypothetical protein
MSRGYRNADGIQANLAMDCTNRFWPKASEKLLQICCNTSRMCDALDIFKDGWMLTPSRGVKPTSSPASLYEH